MKNVINRALVAKKKLPFIMALCMCCIITGCAKRTNQSTEENVEITKIYNLVILDRSGSMTPLREAAVNGYNEVLDVIRTAQQQHNLEQQNLITLTLFNHLVTDVFDCDTVKDIPNLLMKDYQPDGMTAMFDAVGLSLTKLKRKLQGLENATAVVTIISDGLENASHMYTLDDVAKLIDSMKEQGVMFVFMGTNQNVQQVASALHIDEYRYFEYSTAGMKDAWKRSMNASADYYDRMSQYNKDTRGMSKKDRNTYYRDRNKEDGWFDNSKGNH